MQKRHSVLSSDWHIHSRNSCDCRGGPILTTMAETIETIRSSGIGAFGITDHIHTPLNLPDLRASRREFDTLPPSPHMHFGVEVSCVSTWESDHHAQRHAYGEVSVQGSGRWTDVAFGAAVAMLEDVGIRDADLWCLPPKREKTAIRGIST